MDRGHSSYPPPPLGSHPTRAGLATREPRQLSQHEKGSRSVRITTPHDGTSKPLPPPPPTAGRSEERGPTRNSAGRVRTRLSPVSIPRSLRPVAERKSQEENAQSRRAKREQDGDRFDITPDGGSAGREGRQFTVSNVGNHGRIYLRPTVRPANQRYPQPHFVFPLTPPTTAGLDALASERAKMPKDQPQQKSTWTPSQEPSTPIIPRRMPTQDGSPLITNRHRRAHSDSTVQDVSIAHESEPGVFKIVITQPAVDDSKAKTLEDLDPNRSPLLAISIPSWRIGTPRFSVRGTPFIRGSSYAPTEEFRTSSASLLHRSPADLTPHAGSVASRKPSQLYLQPSHSPLLSPHSPVAFTPRLPPPLRATYISAHLVIEPAMFDALTFKPYCDDRALVRYSSASGAVTAATPPRLVAEITSPTFLDYELISDFFLTYRAFLEAPDLLRMLVARLRWALARDDEVGTVVRVRTFVALRHWILNYFIDDFVVDYGLRVTFCTLMNEFSHDMTESLKARTAQLKIVGELKKCWRRICAQYWDGPEFDSSLSANVPIAPGGIAGHRDPSLDPSFWERQDAGPPYLESILRARDGREERSLYADISRAGYIDSVVIGNRPATPEGRPTEDFGRRQTSPTSITSVDVISCSFPAKHPRGTQPTRNPVPLAAHPVDPTSVYGSPDPVAITPKALTGKRVRPAQGHKRNGSLTDSLREYDATTTEKVLFKNAEFLLTLPYAGSLVRGNLFPPGQAFVELVPPSAAGGSSRQTTLFQSDQELAKEKPAASAMSGPGMKRLLGSVRRALSTKGQGMSPTQGNFINISPIGPRGATTNRLPGTAIVPQARPRQNGLRPPVRIDLLGAGVAEDFKKAVREDAAAEAAKQQYEVPVEGSKVPGEMLDYSVANMESSFLLPAEPGVRATTATGITTGSQSIVIVDDTMGMDGPVMTGALPAANSSVEAFADSFLPNAADPTPPNTPPGQGLGTPRRSSYILSQHIMRPSLSADPLPPLAPEPEPVMEEADHLHVRVSEDAVRPSIDSERRMASRPPLSFIRGHLRHRSSRSNRSNMSIGHRRYASFHSGIVPQPTIRSFDATSYSGASVDDGGEGSDSAVPPPLRVLRRRPGGDLRAVTNIGDLDHLPRRSRSLGSLTTFTDSMQSSLIRSPAPDSSGYVDVLTSEYSHERAAAFSLGVIAEQNPKRQVSLFSTHSSKPIMRPSFEAEAKKLAQIPDDVDDDGGVESALLKLEGKYEKRAVRLSMEPRKASLDRAEESPEPASSGRPSDPVVRAEKKEHRHAHVRDEVAPAHGLTHGLADQMLQSPAEISSSSLAPPGDHGHGDAPSFLSEATRDSYSSTPLLERDPVDDLTTRGWTDRSILQGPEEEATRLTEQRKSVDKDSQHPSYEFVHKTDSLERVKRDGSLPRPSTEQSFLDVDSDDESDLSSELSAEVVDADTYDADAFPPMRPGVVVSRIDTNVQSQAIAQQPQPVSQPPSPPMTLARVMHLAPTQPKVDIPVVHEHQVFDTEKAMPPSPQTTPTGHGHVGMSFESERDPTGTKEALRNAPQVETDNGMRKFNVHLPFILAFDSDVLAQQFTLIEKDALNEIDWKELIEMRWKNTEPSDARSWVGFLRNTDARGVEVVNARFNIMVKWAISEIVLTQDLEERARCIIKFIHIAAHCRRFRNIATMSQIAVALTSQDVARLSRTWALVPPADLRTLHELETLVSPMRSFYNLRAEMEGGSADTGCIPFVGIYTHDLLFNAQRPSEIASSPTTAPLVNFERCRISAAIVKTLLRLIEASTRYTFQPVEGIIERCLWMGALTDDEIRLHSEGLQ